MLRLQVKAWFIEAVKLDMEAPRELKESILRGHERLEGFYDNLTAQIIKAEKVLKVRGKTIKKQTLQDFVYDMAKYFMKGLEGEAKRRYETDLQKFYREQEEKKIKEFDAVLDGNPEGEFAEAGVITNEEIDKQREAFLEAQDRAKQVQA
jgi:hypothetical protein